MDNDVSTHRLVQFVLVLDILVAAFNYKGIKFLMLTGQTPVDQRQAMVDEFTEDETIPVFLLSTKAGGVGINLTAASVVIMYANLYTLILRLITVPVLTRTSIRTMINRLRIVHIALDKNGTWMWSNSSPVVR